MSKNNESKIQKEILAYLKYMGYKAWKMPLGPMMVKNGFYAKNPIKGFPDIFGICKRQPGRLFAIEVKTELGKLKPEQKEWQQLLNDLGCLAFVARDIETVKEMMDNHDKNIEQSNI